MSTFLTKNEVIETGVIAAIKTYEKKPGKDGMIRISVATTDDNGETSFPKFYIRDSLNRGDIVIGKRISVLAHTRQIKKAAGNGYQTILLASQYQIDVFKNTSDNNRVEFEGEIVRKYTPPGADNICLVVIKCGEGEELGYPSVTCFGNNSKVVNALEVGTHIKAKCLLKTEKKPKDGIDRYYENFIVKHISVSKAIPAGI